ncbi:unnamed protein product [Effrenium voratum]|nr:unnamed protein product [Effrenium voratum]
MAFPVPTLQLAGKTPQLTAAYSDDDFDDEEVTSDSEGDERMPIARTFLRPGSPEPPVGNAGTERTLDPRAYLEDDNARDRWDAAVSMSGLGSLSSPLLLRRWLLASKAAGTHSSPTLPPHIPQDAGLVQLDELNSRRTTSCSECSEALKPFKSARPPLGEFVDKLEAALSRCLSEYRCQAEEALSEHLSALESIQENYERDLAALTLENQSLRSKLGMKGFEDVKKIIFQSPEGQTRSRRSSQGSVPSVPSRNRWMESEESEKPAKSISAHGRKLSFSGGHGRGKNPNDKIGHNGSWQVFMAWVPSGAALLQAESYRPNEKSQKVLMSRKKQSPCGDFASVMPHDGKVAVARDGEDSESGSSSGSSKADRKEEYTLLPLWEASDRLQKKLRKNSRSEAASSACYEEYEPDFGTLEPPWYVLNPDTGLRVYWDILSLEMNLWASGSMPWRCFLWKRQAASP